MNNTENSKILQILLWLWFGTITSFTITNTFNISKLETETKNLNQNIVDLEKRHLLLKYNTVQK